MAKDATAVWEKIVLLGDELYLAWLVPGQFCPGRIRPDDRLLAGADEGGREFLAISGRLATLFRSRFQSWNRQVFSRFARLTLAKGAI